MRKLKKIAYLFLTVIICVIFIGCGKKVKKNSTVDLSWYINFSWFSGDWGNNMVSKAITEKTGCSISFVTPTGDPNEKLDAMISSDTLPDLITLGWWESGIAQMINEGRFML